MEFADTQDRTADYPVAVRVPAQTEQRNRLTAAFRFFFALPHLILVGGPVAVIFSVDWSSDSNWHFGYGSAGLVGCVATLAAIAAWFAILLAGAYPESLRRFAAFYLRWRVRAIAYMTLLRDEYPPFGDAPYPAEVDLPLPSGPRDRLTVAFRFFLALPHMLVLWLLSIAWAFTTALAWVVILFTRRYPEGLYGFALGVFAWSVRVEAYMLLLTDEYPPFSLRA